MIRFILLGLVIYILYKLIFELFLPIYKTTRQVHSQFRNMQQQAREHAGAAGQNNYPGNRPSGTNPKSTPAGDYIDFEEVK